jgi:hypothetical protein
MIFGEKLNIVFVVMIYFVFSSWIINEFHNIMSRIDFDVFFVWT